jgi:hypothetical protein
MFFVIIVVKPICAGQVAPPAAENQVRTVNYRRKQNSSPLAGLGKRKKPGC